MLPWLFPAYLFGALGGIALVRTFRKTKWGAILWTFIVLCTISLMVITVQSPPRLAGGLGLGLKLISLIPNCIVFGTCAVLLLLLLVFHPTWDLLGGLWLLVAVVPWVLIAYISASAPSIWGFYPLKVHLVDWQDKPLAGIKIHFSEVRVGTSLEQAFVPGGVKGDVITDDQGNASFKVNIYQAINGEVNVNKKGWDNKTLGIAGFTFQPYGPLGLLGEGKKQELQIGWTSKLTQGQVFGESTKFYNASVSCPYPGTLTIHVPGATGEDVSPYPPDGTPP